MKAKYVNPFTDFGFKKLFGEDASKLMLIDFLNSLLPDCKIKDLSFKDKEKLGLTDEDRRAVYDIYCENDKGEKIIVELQKSKQKYFKDRTIFYSSFPIQEQAQTGKWNYELKSVYCIGILDFNFEEDVNEKEVLHTVQLKNQNNQIFFDKLKYVYLEMPNFIKKEHELISRLDKWLYFIKHLEDFKSIPEIFTDNIFIEAFAKAEIAKYNEEELYEYQKSLKIFRDNKAVVDTAFEEGELIGELNRNSQIAKLMLENNEPIEKIIKYTGLSNEEIEKLI